MEMLSVLRNGRNLIAASVLRGICHEIPFCSQFVIYVSVNVNRL